MKPSFAFPRHDGIYWSDGGHNPLKPGWLRRLPLVGARAPVKDGKKLGLSRTPKNGFQRSDPD